MMKSVSFALICVAVLALGAKSPRVANSELRNESNLPNVVAAERPLTVQYFLKKPIYGYTGRENIPLGDFWMCVNIFQTPSSKYAFLWNVMPDSEQWLVIKPTPIQGQSSGQYQMRFTDSWGNEGTGTIEYLDNDRIRVDIEPTKPSEEPPSRNILRQYGTNVLPKGACPYVRFLDGVVP